MVIINILVCLFANKSQCIIYCRNARSIRWKLCMKTESSKWLKTMFLQTKWQKIWRKQPQYQIQWAWTIFAFQICINKCISTNYPSKQAKRATLFRQIFKQQQPTETKKVIHVKYSNIREKFCCVCGRNKMATFQVNNKWENNICIIYFFVCCCFCWAGEGKRGKKRKVEVHSCTSNEMPREHKEK